VAIGTFLRAKRVHHLYPYQAVWRIAGSGGRGNDQLEAYFKRVGGDGFMLSPTYSPGAVEEFVDLVVPVLQRRGLYRTEYRGRTQRDHLRQDD
jgi:N-acetyl-S-(2-succino)cysteine monooxygenase